MGIRAVVLASEQLLPAISFLIHMHHQHGQELEALCILHTNDSVRSQVPAQRLRRLLQDLGVERDGRKLLLAGGNGSMAAVRAALYRWFCDEPDARWVVDATGGNKPMSAAAVEYTLAAGFVADRKVLYRELGAGWSVYGVDDATGLTTLDPPTPGDVDIPPDDVLEMRVPLELLTQTQHTDLVQVRTRQLPMALDVLALCQQAASQRWRWMAHQVPGVGSAGQVFECFIGCGLLAAGLKRLAWSAQVLLPGRNGQGGVGTPMAETDLVLCRGGTVCCIDIKLPGERDADARSTQLSRALHNARLLGGRAVRTIVLRPGWLPDPATHDIARALGVVLIDQQHASAVFSALLRHIDPTLPLPPVLNAVEQLLAEHAAASGGPVLSTTHTVYALGEGGVIDFDATARLLMDHLQRPWVLVRLAPGAYLLQVATAHTSWHGLPDRDALRTAVLAALQVPRPGLLRWRLVRDDVAMLGVELVLERDALDAVGRAVDAACASLTVRVDGG